MPTQDASARAVRLTSLKRMLLAHPGRRWRTSEIAEQLGVSPDTAGRDLSELSVSGSVPLMSNGTTSDFTWEVSPDWRGILPSLQLNYSEGTALYAAARLLSQQQDERNDAVRAALLQLISILPEALRPHLEALVRGLSVNPPVNNISSIFEVLSRAWLGHREVELTYEPLRARAYTCRFAPYLLEPTGIGRTLYFIGHSDPPGALRTYKLERIRTASLTNESFDIPADFDGPALLRRAWGVMYGDGDLVHIRLRFSQFVSSRVRETIWHPSQVLTQSSEGLIWEADIGDITEIRPWIRGWGADCEVLEPVALREELTQEVRRLVRLYGRHDAHSLPEQPGARNSTLLDDLFGTV